MNRRRILLIRPDRLGDMVCALPAVDALRAACPDAKIDLLASPSNAPLAEGCPSVSEILLDGGEPLPRLIRRLRSRRYDAAFALQSSTRTHLAAGLSGARERFGYAGKPFHRLLTRTLPGGGPDEAVHETERNLRLVEAAGVQPSNRIPRLTLNEREHAFADEWLKQRGFDMNAPLIGAHPGASAPSRQYPVERFAFAADAVAERADEAALIAFAGPADIAEARRLVDAAATRAEIAQNMSIREAAALMSRCRLLFANASGPMHIAGALGVPIVAVFGPTDPRRWGPVGSVSRVVEPSALDERAGARQRRRQTRARRIEEVKAEAVAKAAVSLYEETESAR